jgi:hypothetical protein
MFPEIPHVGGFLKFEILGNKINLSNGLAFSLSYAMFYSA